MKWWSPPKQRQRWGEAHILPSDSWGQIFFDLFYVGGAYNLGNAIKTSEMGWKSILYFCAAGFPSMIMWYDKLYFDARFTTRPGTDGFHRFLEILQLCCVATALSRIRSVEILSHPCQHVDMFQFSLSLFFHSMVAIGRYVEVIKFGIGDPGARIVGRRDIAWRIVPTLLLLGAAVESGMSYYTQNGEDNENCPAYEAPIWLCLASWISWVVIGYCDQVLFAPKKLCIETMVPMNVHFCMHRYGEWFMIMFGESIMSLLIVEGDNESLQHSVKFYSGVLSVIFLAHLHFQSEPRHDQDHALIRSRHSNYLYNVLVPVYSMALIATGICYKMFLFDCKNDNGGGDHRRALGDAANDDSTGDGSDSAERKQQFSANLFSGSITIVLICTDLTTLLHQGTHAIWKKIQTIPRCRFVFLAVSKYSLVCFLASMSTLQNDPHFMTVFALGAILFQEFLRKSFKSWQRKISHADDGSTDSDETAVHATFTGYSTMGDDYNYQFDIENFADAKMAYAKFEQQWMDEAKEQLQKNRSLQVKSSKDAASAEFQLQKPSKAIMHTYYAC